MHPLQDSHSPSHHQPKNPPNQNTKKNDPPGNDHTHLGRRKIIDRGYVSSLEGTYYHHLPPATHKKKQHYNCHQELVPPKFNLDLAPEKLPNPNRKVVF